MTLAIRDVVVPAGRVRLRGELALPPGTPGVVVLAHPWGSVTHGYRTVRAADALHQAGLGTLALDLLTPDEEVEDRLARHLRFDVPLLAGRVVAAVDAIRTCADTAGLAIGLYGAGAAAAAALVAAAERPDEVLAVVVRGGFPELPEEAAERVRAHTLLVAGDHDVEALRTDLRTLARLGPRARLVQIPGATALFDEPGTLGRAIDHAVRWFVTWLGRIDADTLDAPYAPP